MKICGTNLIPILITIVSCGVIFMYFNVRLAEVKMAVDKQNRVLTSFITNVQNDIKNGGTIMGANILGGGFIPFASAGASATGASATVASATGSASESAADFYANVGVNHLASEEALRTVKLNQKIVVSDDDDSDSSDDSDSESNTSSDSEDDIQDITSEDIKVINLQDCVSLELITDNLPLDFEQVPTSIQQQEQLPTIVDDSSVWHVSELQDESANILKVVDLNTSVDLTKADVSYEQMKVDDLRKIVLDFTLASKDEVKKLKKPELLTLLKNKTA